MQQGLTSEELDIVLHSGLYRRLIGDIEAAALDMQKMFTDRGGQYDPYLAAMYMRYCIRQKLAESEGTEFDEENHGFCLLKPANIGIRFDFMGIRFYVWRNPKDGIRPGGSPARRKFLNGKEPDQRALGAWQWRANVILLVNFDSRGNIIAIKAIQPSGFNDQGELQMLLDYDLPTTAAEYYANEIGANFIPPVENDDLLVAEDGVAIEEVSFQVVEDEEKGHTAKRKNQE